MIIALFLNDNWFSFKTFY